MPEWRSSRERRVKTVIRDGVETSEERDKKTRVFRFNTNRAMFFALALVIAEIASWIDRYA